MLTLRTNLNTAYACERESFALAEATDISIRMQDCLVASQQMPLEEQEIPINEAPRAATKSKEVKEVVLVPGDRSKTAQIRANLDPELEDALINFLREHVNVFAWKPIDMPDVPRELIEHSLNVSATAKPIKQKLR